MTVIVQPTAEDYIQRMEERIQPKAIELMAADPKLPFISAYIMAQDITRMEDNLVALTNGEYDWAHAEAMTGSYGRMELRVQALELGLITIKQAVHELPHHWSAADPDDTDPRFLALWTKAFRLNEFRTLRDRKDTRIPKVKGTSLVRVFRGQDRGAKFGIAWSLSKLTAQKFANGAATRESNRGGVVYEGLIDRAHIMGYITGRGEHEIVFDPKHLSSSVIVV